MVSKLFTLLLVFCVAAKVAHTACPIDYAQGIAIGIFTVTTYEDAIAVLTCPASRSADQQARIAALLAIINAPLAQFGITVEEDEAGSTYLYCGSTGRKRSADVAIAKRSAELHLLVRTELSEEAKEVLRKNGVIVANVGSK